MKRQTVYHTYGTDDDEDDDEMSNEEGTTTTTTTTTRHATAQHASASGTRAKCKCGSYQHRYTSQRLCPLNKKKQASVRHESDTTSNKAFSSSDTEEIAQLFCDCGDRATHSRSCPLNQGTTMSAIMEKSNGLIMLICMPADLTCDLSSL